MAKVKVATPEYLKAWRIANQDKVQAYKNIRNEARKKARAEAKRLKWPAEPNPTRPTEKYKPTGEALERRRERSRQYHAANKERNAAYRKNYFAENKDRFAAYCAKRLALKMQAIVPWSDSKHEALMYQKAAEWSRILGVKLHVDHVVPLKSDFVCGLHVPANLQLMDGPLNSAKRNRTWPDMWE